MLVLGITGRNCAGKDTVADFLERRGFERHSLSDVLREELRVRGVPITRTALIDVGRELRRNEGPAVLAERMKKLIRTERVALVSVRSPAEVKALRGVEGFHLLSVEAPVEVRFRREIERKREGPAPTLDEFMALEKREDTADSNAQQLSATIAMADRVVANDGSLERLEERVAALLGEIDVR